MKNLESKIEKNFDNILLGTMGVGIVGEVIYYAVTGDTLPGGGLTGFYRGFMVAGPALCLSRKKLFQYFSRNNARMYK